MWPWPGTVPALLQPGAVQSPSAFVPALPPAARTRSQGQPGHSLCQPRRGTSVPATVTLGGKRSPPHSSLGAGQMLLLESWTLARMGCPRRLGLAGDGVGLWQGPNPGPWGLPCLPGPPSPALPGDLPLLTITHTQPHLAGSAWPGDMSGPSPCLWTSPPTWAVPIHCHTLGWTGPVWGQTSLLLRGAIVAPLPHPSTARACPSSAGTAPLTPGDRKSVV